MLLRVDVKEMLDGTTTVGVSARLFFYSFNISHLYLPYGEAFLSS